MFLLVDPYCRTRARPHLESAGDHGTVGRPARGRDGEASIPVLDSGRRHHEEERGDADHLRRGRTGHPRRHLTQAAGRAYRRERGAARDDRRLDAEAEVKRCGGRSGDGATPFTFGRLALAPGRSGGRRERHSQCVFSPRTLHGPPPARAGRRRPETQLNQAKTASRRASPSDLKSASARAESRFDPGRPYSTEPLRRSETHDVRRLLACNQQPSCTSPGRSRVPTCGTPTLRPWWPPAAPAPAIRSSRNMSPPAVLAVGRASASWTRVRPAASCVSVTCIASHVIGGASCHGASMHVSLNSPFN
jgi:hypothetical protein